MSGSTRSGAGEDDAIADAGSSTEQHITGAAETGTFLTDRAPTAHTPAHGSSNAGVNEVGANRRDPDDATGGPLD